MKIGIISDTHGDLQAPAKCWRRRRLWNDGSIAATTAAMRT